MLAVLAQDLYTNGVERAHVRHKAAVVGVFAQQHRHAFAHFAGSFVGECHGQNVEWRGFSCGDKIGDTVRQRLGFARPCASLNKQRSFGGFYGAALLGVKALHQFATNLHDGRFVGPGVKNLIHNHILYCTSVSRAKML